MKDTIIPWKSYESTCFDCPKCLVKETKTHIIYYHNDGIIHSSFNKKALIDGVVESSEDKNRLYGSNG